MSLVVIDIITEGRANVFAALMGSLEAYATPGGCDGAQVCAASLRIAKKHVHVWPHVLEVGAQLPTLPLWLNDELSVPLELERTYEETCKVLRLT